MRVKLTYIQSGKGRVLVQRRKVFYIPGYDPIHPRRYRELYRKQGMRQAAISGYDLSLKAGPTGGRYGWQVDTLIDGHAVSADIEVLVWSDIVRSSMETGILGTYAQLCRTAWIYISRDILRRLFLIAKAPVAAALYPIGWLLLQLLLGVIAAGASAAVLWFIHPLLSLLGIAALPAVLMWFRKNDNRFYAYYLMHDYAYSAQSRGATSPELQVRLAEFADEIRTALHSDYDEVLVVGHSSGAHLGVSILSELIRKGGTEGAKAQLGFLSLGHVVPMVSFLPDAYSLRQDLRYLCTRGELTWVDVTAQGDGCCFALCDPVAVTGVAPPDQKWPIVFSAAFSQTMGEAEWIKNRRRYFDLHFQYLCAFERPRDYDYFKITAGPASFAETYANRASSANRKTRATNRYKALTP